METEDINELYNKASELFSNGEYVGALECYYRLLSFNINSSIAHYNVGVVCAILGEFELAVAFYKKAIRIDDKNVRAVNNLAGIYVYNIQNIDIATQYLDHAIKIAPNDPEAYNLYGNICLQKKDFKKAKLYFEKAIFFDENYFKNYYDLACACVGLELKPEAEKALDKCLELYPNYPAALELKNNL